jgi:hypothetical protein
VRKSLCDNDFSLGWGGDDIKCLIFAYLCCFSGQNVITLDVLLIRLSHVPVQDTFMCLHLQRVWSTR